jgi:hypothetical protein
MSNTHEVTSTEPEPQSRPDLGHQNRKIGISAVAAALPYGGARKNQNYEPAKPKILTIRDLEWLVG